MPSIKGTEAPRRDPDVDSTSLNGACAAKADLTDTDRVKTRVTKFTYGRKGNRKVCQPDSIVFASPSQ